MRATPAYMEAFLVDLATTKAKWLLRGGMVMSVWCKEQGITRPASDIDLSCLDHTLDEAVEICRSIATVTSVENTWMETPRPGRKLTIAEGFTVDIATPDLMIDEPISGPYGFLTASLETAFAWKLHSLFERKSFWHPRHLADLYLMIKHFPLQESLTASAIRLAFHSRETELHVMNYMFMGHMGVSSGAKHRWRQFLGRVPFAAIIPEVARDAVLVVAEYVKRILGMVVFTEPQVKIMSFSYSDGKPEATICIGVRHWPPPPANLRHLTGLNEILSTRLFSNKLFAVNYSELLERLQYAIESANGPITIAIGCENGKHKSVALVEKLTKEIPGTIAEHRDL